MVDFYEGLDVDDLVIRTARGRLEGRILTRDIIHDSLVSIFYDIYGKVNEKQLDNSVYLLSKYFEV